MTKDHSAVHGAVYFHALEPFTGIVLRTEKELTTTFRDSELKVWKELQLFRLNPKHQVPVPKVTSKDVSFQPGRLAGFLGGVFYFITIV